MSVQDFPPRPEGATPDSPAMVGWLDALRNRHNSDALNTVTTVSSADETYIFSVSANKTYKATVSQIVSNVNLGTVTNSLAGDVALNSTTQYFDGPSVSAAWPKVYASGAVTVFNSSGADLIDAKLWDGTTVVDTRIVTAALNNYVAIPLSGFFTSMPVGNIKISVRDTGSTSGKIIFNASGNSKDSTITALRIG